MSKTRAARRVAAPVLSALGLAMLSTVMIPGSASAAPPELRCKAKFDPLNPDPNPGSPGWNVNCFVGEVFLLDGSQTVPLRELVPNPEPGQPAIPTDIQRALVDCTERPNRPGVKNSSNCFVGALSSQLIGPHLKVAVDRVVEYMTKANLPGGLPQWDEMVLLRNDFSTTQPSGPLFYRERNATLQRDINEVANIGLETIPRDGPFIGYIDGGNTSDLGDDPLEDPYLPCGFAVPPGAIPRADFYPEATICPPGPYFTYFDALAQATAAIYGPYLKSEPAHGGLVVTMPALKGALVTGGAAGSAAARGAGAAALNVWNAWLDMSGSLLGGNTFRPNGNDTFGVGRPPPFQGVSAPFEGKQRPRFHPLDLYLLGFLPTHEIPPIRSFMHLTVADVVDPLGLVSFINGVGFSMGTRLDGVGVRLLQDFTDKGAVSRLPRALPLIDVLSYNGGERQPPYAAAPQFLRQLWVVITKPPAVLDAAATDLSGGVAEMKPVKLAEQVKNQLDLLAKAQRYRRHYAGYFHTLTSYRGRLHSTFEGNVDDNPYWEFGAGRDDGRLFVGAGGLDLELPGPEAVPNSGGRIQTVMRVLNTPGSTGQIVYQPLAGQSIRIDSDQSHEAPTNVVTLRMRVPFNAELLAAVRANPQATPFYAEVTLTGGAAPVTVRIPGSENAALLPDGQFHDYSASLVGNQAFIAGGSYSGISIVPSNRAMQNIDIDFIRIGFADAGNDSDVSCGKSPVPQPDGWPDSEDNCPTVYNPTQDDANGDGVGDACEDFDTDKTVNACDNCPSISNSSQRDRDGKNGGDACDPESTEGCFTDGSVAGGLPRSGAPTALLAVAAALLGLVLARRRRR